MLPSGVWEPKSNLVHFSLKYDNDDNNFRATVSKTVRPMLSHRSLSCLSVTLVYCGQKVGWLEVKLGLQIGLRPGDCVRWGPSSPLPRKVADPQFSAHVYCGQTAGWIKMALGMEVGLSPGHIVLDGDPAPLPQKGDRVQIFGPCLLWPNGQMDQDSTWYRGRPRSRRHCVKWGPSSLPHKKGAESPIFGPCLL